MQQQQKHQQQQQGKLDVQRPFPLLLPLLKLLLKLPLKLLLMLLLLLLEPQERSRYASVLLRCSGVEFVLLKMRWARQHGGCSQQCRA